MLIRKTFWSAIFFFVLSVIIFTGAKAAVTLVSFTATPGENSILIEWETATEFDNSGFIVSRNTAPHPPYLDVSGFIPAEGSGIIGANYQFQDTDVVEGTTYFYMLEAWDNSNQVEYHGPISATIGGPPTNTPTITATATDTNTPTPTRTLRISRTPTRTLSASRTPLPTRTYTQVPPTFTPTYVTATPTITPTATITPSPTLYDPPEIVLVFPETETPIPTQAPTVTAQAAATPTQENNNRLAKLVESGSLLTIGAICLVVLIWAVIAVAVFIYLQKRNS